MAARTKSKVTPKYKRKYRVKNWPAYEHSLRKRGDMGKRETCPSQFPRAREISAVLAVLDEAVLSKVLAVIGSQDDQGVVQEAPCLQVGQQLLKGAVDQTHSTAPFAKPSVCSM